MTKSSNHKTDIAGLVSVLMVVYAVWANAAGWVLSAFSNLNAIGYLLAAVPFLYVCYKSLRTYLNASYGFRPVMRKWRMHEYAFGGVIIIIFLGAVVNPPFGWDVCAYRLPRVLRWLSEQKWYWLNSADDRMDISALGFEWMMAPHFALLKTDRLLFLINLLPYLCLPNLCWFAARAIRVPRQWALISSILVPLGFCYSLQAGGLQNDGIGAFFALLPLALLHKNFVSWLSEKEKWGISILSIAMLTGLKLTNIPIAGIIFLWILWIQRNSVKSYLKDLKLATSLLILAFLCSVLPISIINVVYAGHWSGDAVNRYKHKSQNPISAVLANVLFLSSDAVSPNLLAWQMNDTFRENNILKSLIKHISEDHPNIKYFRFSKYGYEGESGPSTPILAGITFLLLIGILFYRNKQYSKCNNRAFLFFVAIAYIVFMANVAVHGSQRHAAPYYPLLVIGALVCSASNIRLMPDRLINSVIVICCGITVATLLVSPVRPMLPKWACDRLDQKGGSIQLHRDASQRGGVLQAYSNQRVFCITQWGAVTHRLWKPYFQGEMIEINSNAFDQKMMTGGGLLYLTEAGVLKRYNLTLQDFLRIIGDNHELNRDPSVDPRNIGEFGILYWVEDLSKVPPVESSRLYPSS